MDYVSSRCRDTWRLVLDTPDSYLDLGVRLYAGPYGFSPVNFG